MSHLQLDKIRIRDLDLETLRANTMKFYEAALQNRAAAEGIDDVDERAKCLANGQPQVPNVLANAYADIINNVLKDIEEPVPTVHAAVSNRRGSRTSSISLFDTRNPYRRADSPAPVVPLPAEFAAALEECYFVQRKKSTPTAYQVTRVIGNPAKREALYTPFDPKWLEDPTLASVRAASRG